MAIGEFFAKINEKMNEKYNGMCDFLSNKGIPFNKYNEFLESHGIPAMWANIMILILIIVIIVLITMLVLKSSLILHVSFEDPGKNTLSSVFLTLSSNDNPLYGQITSNGEITISDVCVGDVLKVSASLSGYRLVSPTEITVNDKEQYVTFILDKQITTGSMQLRLIDKKTQTIIPNADVNVIFADGEIISGKSDESGTINFSSVPLGQPITIKIKKDGYLEVEQIQAVNENGITDISLEPNDLVCGEKGTITFVVSSIGQPVDNAKITVYSNDNKKIAEEITDPEGKSPINLPKCIALRYVVAKEGYVTFDSKDTNKNITVMQNSETRPVYLDVGGSKITVIVKDDSDKEIVGANVALYSENGLIIDNNLSNIYGQVEFSGVDVKRGLFVSANYPNYYPNSILINQSTLPPYVLTLKKVDLTKAGRVQLFAADLDNKPVANAFVEMFKVTNNGELPIYLADNKTTITGYLGVMLDPETNLKINVSNENLFGTKTQQLVSGDNKFEIVMTQNQKVNTLYVYGVNGKALKNAKLTIDTEQQTLFDGNTADGKVDFVAGAVKEVQATVIDDQGNIYSKLLQVKDKMELTLSPLDISKDPKISFLGIYDATGSKVNGVKVNSTYYFKFSVIWPNNQTNGEAHIRLGEDNVPAVSMSYSIIGVDAIGPKKEYGLYYSDLESTPKDLQVFGRAGIKNKWVNVIYTNPKGLSEFKVKVKVEDVQDVNKVLLHYRATSFDGKIYTADPKSEISLTDTKLQKLHSLAKQETINVFSNLFECSNVSNICYSYSFVDGLVKYPEFSAVQDEQYALDLEFYSLTDLQAPLDFNANSLLQTIVLNNTSSDLTSFSPSTAELQSLKENLILKAGQITKLRVYFTAKKQGTGSINMSSSLVGINKNFDFRIDGQKTMNVSINSNMIEYGKPIIFGVSDTQGKINNATISITEDNATTNVFVQGNNTSDKGLDGKYVISPLPSGIYNYEIRSQGHVTYTGNFIVTRFGVLNAKQEYEIRIPVGKTNIDYDIEFANISDLPVTKLAYAVLRDDAKAFTVNYRFLKSNMLPGSTNKLQVSASVDSTQVIYGDQDLVISGTINNNEVVRTVVHLIFVSNTDLDNSCLVITPNEITASIYDTQKQKFTTVLSLENNCEFDFQSLQPQLISRETNELQNAIDFSSTAISLKRGEKKTMNVSMLSNITLADTQSLELFLNFDTGYFKKQIPVHAKLIHSFGGLYISVTNPQLFLAANQIVTMPLFINSIGTSALRNVTIMIQPYNTTPYTMNVPYSDLSQSSYYNPLLNGSTNRSIYDAYNQYQDTINPYSTMDAQGIYQASQTYVNAQVTPNPRILAYVQPGQTAMSQLIIRPPATQKSNVVSAFTIRVQGYTVTDSKPVVAVTPVFVSISSPKCLKFNSPNPQGIFFKSSKLDVTLENENTSITNECAEPVQLDLPITKQIGENSELQIDLENNIIAPMQTVNMKSTFFAGDELDNIDTVQIKATGQNTKSNFGFIVTYNFSIGRTAFGKEKIPSDEKEVSVCNSDTKLSLKYPKIGQDCSQSYCDAQTAGDYIHGQIVKYVKNYDTTVAKYVKNLSTTSCKLDSSSCSFEKIGMESMPITLYLMNDKLTQKYLDDVLPADADTHMKTVYMLPTENFDIEQQSAMQFSKLFVDSSIAKCGKYTLQLGGAFAINNGVPLKESFNLLLQANYESTPECEPEIQNALLFLPKDTKAQMNNTYEFFEAYVDYDKDVRGLDVLAKELSKKLFNNERVASGKTNTLYLTKGTVGNFMKVDLDEKNNVVVTLDNEVDTSKVDEIVRNIDAFLKGNYDGCIKGNKKEANFIGATDTKSGMFKLQVPKTPLNLCYGDQTMKIGVLSSGAGQAELYYTPSNTKSNGYDVAIKDKDNNSVSKVNFVSKENREYNLEVNINDPSRLANSIKPEPLKLILKPNTGNEIVETISFVPNGVSPSDFITKVMKESGLKNSEYYALIYWQGGNEKKDGCQVIDEVQEKNESVSIKAKTASGSQCNNTNTKPLVNAVNLNFAGATLAASTAGMVACMGSEALLSYKQLFGPFGWISSAITCGLIVGDLAATSIYANHRVNVATGESKWNAFDSIHDGANNWGLGWLLNNYDDPNSSANTNKAAAENAVNRDYFSWTGDDAETAALGATVKSAKYATNIFGTTKGVALVSAQEKMVANAFTDSLSNAMSTQGVGTNYLTSQKPTDIFDYLKGKDPAFKKTYDDFVALATKKGVKPEQLFAEHMKSAANKSFDAMAGATKELADAETKLAKLAKNESLLNKELTKLNTELTKAKVGTKKYNDLKTLLSKTQSELDEIVDLRTKITSELNPKILDTMDEAAKSVAKPSTFGGKFGRFWNNRWTSLGKGIFKGVLSSAAAVEGYNDGWSLVMNTALSNDKIVAIDLTVPDNFVKQKTYEFDLTKDSQGTYTGIIKETVASNAPNFCNAETLKRGYIAGNLMSEVNGTEIISDEERGKIDLSNVTGTKYPTGCKNYSELYKKYGEVLANNTNNALNEKYLVALIKNESSFNPNAISGTSAVGLGQFTLGTFCGYTYAFSNGKYSDYSSKFDKTVLLNYGAKDFKELYKISCVSPKEGKSQCTGGVLYYKKGCSESQQNVGKDPRSNPELSIMFMAAHLEDNYKKKNDERAAIESYVIGPRCILGPGKYSTTSDCLKNSNLNETVVPGTYWTGILSNLKTADTCLSSTATSNTNNNLSPTGKINCNNNTKVLVIGDSITVGYFPELKKLLPNCNLKSMAITGKSTDWMLTQFMNDSEKYDVVIVMGGTNDVANSAYSESKTQANLSRIFNLAKTEGSRVFALSVVPYNPNTDKINKLNSWLSNLSGIEYIDIASGVISRGITTNPHRDYGVIAKTVHDEIFS